MPVYVSTCFCVLLAGVSRLMDLLADSREVIRNDVSIDQRLLILFIISSCQLCELLNICAEFGLS